MAKLTMKTAFWLGANPTAVIFLSLQLPEMHQIVLPTHTLFPADFYLCGLETKKIGPLGHKNVNQCNSDIETFVVKALLNRSMQHLLVPELEQDT